MTSFDVKPTGLHLQESDMTSSLATEDQHHLLPCCKDGCHIAENVLFLKKSKGQKFEQSVYFNSYLPILLYLLGSICCLLEDCCYLWLPFEQTAEPDKTMNKQADPSLCWLNIIL